MSTDVTLMQSAVSSAPSQCATAVRRDAFYLPSQQGPLFAWLHSHAGETSFDHGVVICAPIGYEQLHAHRSLRHLADALARRRIPVLRFDWHGTGDSAGDDSDPARVTTWVANVRDAMRWMQRDLGCRRMSLVGMRAGALLAAEALAEHEIENLVLWAPVVSGRAYVREMTLIDRSGDAPSSEVSAGIEAAGFLMTPWTSSDLSRLSLLKMSPRCRRALIVERDNLASDARLVEHLAESGVEAEQVVAPGYMAMMAEPHRGEVPMVAIQLIASWMEQHIACESAGALRIDPSILGPVTATMSVAADATSPEGIICETAWPISAQPNLFGITSEPVVPSNTNVPTILILNAGSTYRAGPGRLNVFLARQMAARGYRCVRMDVRGLGDSVLADSTRENDCYAATALSDIQLAIEALERRYGTKRCVLMGLCSGAYAAFQSAVQLDTPTLIESVLINPLTYYWNDSMKVDDVMAQQLLADHYSMSAAKQWSKWWRFLTGRTRLTLPGAMRLLVQCIGRQASSLVPSRATTDRRMAGKAPSHPECDDLAGDLHGVVQRCRTLALFVSRTDPGYAMMKHQAKRQAKHLVKSGKLRVAFIDNADHTFSRQGARVALLQAIANYLRSRFE
ncbi:MAG TPA: alpha/beta fold hydrolase [Pirellulales bacterium]|jgi:pimeloyl-ACP methyl ester carboxylesterase|nr:alpha/beta fold hydrolase [Pirellulales bacterium]